MDPDPREDEGGGGWSDRLAGLIPIDPEYCCCG